METKKLLRVDIKGGYENIYVDCPLCKKENILNRISDLNTIQPISRLEISCFFCKESFLIGGDRVSSQWGWFIDERHLLREKKEYRMFVLSLCQGCECFFEAGIVNLVGDRDISEDDEILWKKRYIDLPKTLVKNLCNTYSDKYATVFSNATFNDLRRIFLYQMSKRAPIKKSDKQGQEAIRIIEKTDINIKRNNVVHKSAYRPSLQDIDSYESLANAIYSIADHLKITFKII